MTILSMAVITFVNRYAFFIQGMGYQPSARVKRFLSYSSYAVLTSIWTPILFELEWSNNSSFVISHAGLDYLIAAGLAALLTIMRVRSIVVVLLSTALFYYLRLIVFAQ